jgi:hypothetical protein
VPGAVSFVSTGLQTSFPSELLANSQTDFVGDVTGEHLNISDACLAERFLLDCVADRSGAPIVACTLEFNCNDWPAGLINDVRRQGFCDNGRWKLREVLAHRFNDFKQPAADAAGAGWQWSVV